jgi:hypothetical protein
MIGMLWIPDSLSRLLADACALRSCINMIRPARLGAFRPSEPDEKHQHGSACHVPITLVFHLDFSLLETAPNPAIYPRLPGKSQDDLRGHQRISPIIGSLCSIE